MVPFVLGLILSVLIYLKLIKPCRYWKSRGIKHAACWPAVGSMGKVVFRKEAFVDVGLKLYNKFPEDRYVGYMQFMQQCLLIRDIEIIKRITVKDFDHFTDHVIFGQGTDSDPLLSKSLISLSGQKWKDMRATLSPAFTSSKMKNMYFLIDECAESFVTNFSERADLDLEMRDTFQRFACNVIASTAFGIQIDCMREPENEFFKMSGLMSDFTNWQTAKLIFSQTFPKIAQLIQLGIFPHNVTTFFRAIVKANIQKREEEGIVRPDLIHLLLEARKGKLKTEKTTDGKNEGFATVEESESETVEHVELTDEHIVAQAMLFFFAGFDTVSTTASFMSHELALSPDIQKKLQQEIDYVRRKYDNKIPYDAILGMKYLDQVVSETLRLWPAAFETDRLCVKDYVIESLDPEKEGFLIKKGVDLVIPIMGIHRDDQYYSEPNRFDPERFNDGNKSKIVPGTYLPFGWGPRNCIGSRFALLEVKTLFCHILAKFDIVPIAKTEIPIKISPMSFNLQPETGFWLSLQPRKETLIR